MNKWLVLIISFFLCTTAFANFNAPFKDFAPNRADQIFTDTSEFNNPDQGILGASDTTVQQALDTLNRGASTVSAILQCETSDDFCFRYTSSQLILYVNGTIQVRWPSIVIVEKLLLGDGLSNLLLDDGTSVLLISQ